MDYNRKYDSLSAKFLDPKQIYYREDTGIPDPYSVYTQGFNTAFDMAVSTLNQRNSGGKVRTDSLWTVFKNLYIKRIEKEQAFLNEWKKHYNKNKLEGAADITASIPIPPSTNAVPTEKQMVKYARDFSKFIYLLLGINLAPDNEDGLIIRTLRDSKFIERIAGQSSAVFSTSAAKRAEQNNKKSIRVGQSMINSYYEELFGVFCLNRSPRGYVNKFEDNGAKLILKDTLTELTKNEREYLDKQTNVKKINSVKPQAIFQKNFTLFIKKYYPELKDKIDKNFFNNISQHFEDIYTNFKGAGSKPIIILHGSSENRGVSYDNEQQLKKMLLETLRWGAGHTGDYSAFEIPGLLDIHERWDQGDQFFYKEIQVKINDLREQFKQEGEDGKDRRMTYEKKINEEGKKEHDLDKPLTRHNVEEQIANYFFDWLIGQIRSYTGKTISDEGRRKLKRATLAKISGYYTWGNKLLKKLSAFGPQQVRGLIGEIATAYSIEAHSGLGNEIVGASMSSSGTGQSHYDVEAVLNGNSIGFQVKNYKTGDSINGLYATSLGLGQQAMYRYFSKEEVRNYRWLFANGLFLSSKGGDRRFNGPDSLRKKMEESFLDNIPYFLRIGDAANGDLDQQINSDIYVIGDYYYPSSYLIIAAYQAARKRTEEIKRGGNVKRLITITGKFPNYSKKYKTDEQHTTNKLKEYDENKQWTGNYVARDKYKQVRISSSGKSKSYEDANLIYIDRLKTRLLDATINFSGITVKFKV